VAHPTFNSVGTDVYVVVKRPGFEADYLLYLVPMLRVSVPQTPLSPVPSFTLHLPSMNMGSTMFITFRK
jgi:hypothetical protein